MTTKIVADSCACTLNLMKKYTTWDATTNFINTKYQKIVTANN